MKNAILATGAALLLAVLLSSPTFAQTSARPTAELAANAANAAPDATPLDGLIDDAVTQEDRARMLLRCVGPPPRLPTHMAALARPGSEPVVIVASAEGATPR